MSKLTTRSKVLKLKNNDHKISQLIKARRTYKRQGIGCILPQNIGCILPQSIGCIDFYDTFSKFYLN